MPRLSKIGAAALAAFGWTGLQTVTADFLVVAGGGGGATAFGAGGGAGGYRTSAGTSGGGASAEAKLSLNPTQSYTVTIGAGGAGGTGSGDGANGTNSVFSTITSTGGGRGGWNGGAGSSGGSGGAGGNQGGTSSAAGAGTANQGFAGGTGSGSSSYGSGGGGGAGAAGSNGTTSTCGAGGVGVASSISGTSTYYAGGGGGGATAVFGITTPGNGGNGGGGKGSDSTSSWVGYSGEANKGGGGGGGGYTSGGVWQAGGQGGSGIVIISYAGPQQFGGGIVTSSGGNTIHTFTTSGTLSPLSSLTASALVVAGGGGGGAAYGGGGGAGGYRTGSNLILDTNSIYAVIVGAGGVGAIDTPSTAATNGGDSVLLNITSTGGGYGGNRANNQGANGGSGGGGNGGYASANGLGNTPSTSPSQGNNGGTAVSNTPYHGGGGGGASAAGGAGTTVCGAGGDGTANSISGSSVTYAGGGGGGGDSNGGAGGAGGGGAGTGTDGNGTSGTANLGGGGGGGGSNDVGGNGGSGIVIISYPGSTPQMAGGTVTVAGGNVIHTFTSSGYLTPIVLVTKSLRFRSSASAYLNRTMTTATNNLKWTWSAWVKRGTLGTTNILFNAGDGTSNDFGSIQFRSEDTLQFSQISGGAYNVQVYTTAVFRDPSAWYHVVLVYDSPNATSTDRVQIYVNGTRQTALTYATGPFAQNTSSKINSALAHYISKLDYASLYFDGYLAEVNFIDGQALTPSSFGSFNGLGVWQPIRYGGSYGKNGFYLPFTNTTSTTTLGYDFSPNGNNWTTNNISLTAGSTYDSMKDVPTLTDTDTANYCVLNPLAKAFSQPTFSNANLQISAPSAWSGFIGTLGVTSGKWYWEVVNGNSDAYVGICGSNLPFGLENPQVESGNIVYYGGTGEKRVDGAMTSYGASYSTETIGVALDIDGGTVTFYKNNTSQGSISLSSSTLNGKTIFPFFVKYASTATANFGQRPFAYTPPTGFKALNTFNLPTPTIGATASTQADDYFNAVLYSGNSSTQNIAVGFQPDFVWSKCRNVARSHRLSDAVRGSTRDLYSDTTSAEQNDGSITSFISTGFSLNNATGSSYNTSGETYVSWAWKANGSGSTNTAGSIISTVSANTTAGFSIVTYTGNGTASTVGHGLLVGGVATAPSMIIVKSRSTAQRWTVYHTSTSNAYIYLNETFAAETANAQLRFGNNSSVVQPTSTVFSIGNSVDVNQNTTTYVAYCFAQVAGYSAFGSYTGNGSSDGPFVFLGFRPKYIMVKKSSGESNWQVLDSSRSPYNLAGEDLLPNASDAEKTIAQGFNQVDMLSNGFKIRNTNCNDSGGTYIYMAFAESPFKYANAR